MSPRRGLSPSAHTDQLVALGLAVDWPKMLCGPLSSFQCPLMCTTTHTPISGFISMNVALRQENYPVSSYIMSNFISAFLLDPFDMFDSLSHFTITFIERRACTLSARNSVLFVFLGRANRTKEYNRIGTS